MPYQALEKYEYLHLEAIYCIRINQVTVLFGNIEHHKGKQHNVSVY